LQFIFLIICNIVCQFTCTEQKAPDDSKAVRFIQYFGSLVWSLLHVTLLVSRVWRRDLGLENLWVPLAILYIIFPCRLFAFQGPNPDVPCKWRLY